MWQPPVVDTPSQQPRPSWVTPTLLAAIEAKRNDNPTRTFNLTADLDISDVTQWVAPD